MGWAGHSCPPRGSLHPWPGPKPLITGSLLHGAEQHGAPKDSRKGGSHKVPPSGTLVPSATPAHLGWRVAASAQAAFGVAPTARPSRPSAGCPWGAGGRPRARAQALSHLELELGVHLGVLLGLLVAVVQMLHEHGHHHVDEHELGREHEADEVQRRHEVQAAQAAALVVGAVPQRVLRPGRPVRAPGLKAQASPLPSEASFPPCPGRMWARARGLTG